MLEVEYSLWVGGFNVFGTIVGMLSLNVVMKMLGRQSPLVMLLVLIFAISVIAVPYFGIQDLKGVENIWELSDICS
jgi:uncharacterized membrane protein YuzA (DUF378 family)